MNLDTSHCPSEFIQFMPTGIQTSSNPWTSMFRSGTAGATTEFYVRSRLGQGAVISFPNPSLVEVAATKTDVELLIEQLQPSMTQLAAAFGVTRQTIYDWRAGKGVSQENTEQLKRLVTACTTLNRSSVNLPPRAGDRLLPGGKTFWESVASGVAPNQAAEQLIELLKREQKERVMLGQIRTSTQGIALFLERPLLADKLDE
jgi:DNA-binding transcriptional regulator YiaG